MANITIGFRCPMCGRVHTLSVSEDGLRAYENGAYVQDAFPELSATEREQILTHFCPSCIDDMYSSMEEDEEEESSEEDYEEPSDLECGFDPYEGCYTYDC